MNVLSMKSTPHVLGGATSVAACNERGAHKTSYGTSATPSSRGFFRMARAKFISLSRPHSRGECLYAAVRIPVRARIQEACAMCEQTASEMSDAEGNCLIAKTAQSAALKTLFETLKDLLEDVALEFDRDGVRLIATDNTSIAMVHTRLDAAKFDEFHCPTPLTVGVNMPCLHKLVRSIGSSDTIAFFMATPDASELGIHVENHERRTSTNFKISVMDIPSSTIEVPPVAFDSCVVLPSTDMQVRCKRDTVPCSLPLHC